MSLPDKRRGEAPGDAPGQAPGKAGSPDPAPRLTIGDLARQAGVTTKTVRHYEEIGLLAPAGRGDNQYRYYTEAQLNQLRFIRRAQRLGLTLAEIGQLMGLASQARCNELRASLDDLFSRKIREYELRIAALRTLQQELRPEENACACQAFVPNCDCLPTGGKVE